ncbi:DNA polymerase, partial [Desulfovibrio sp.]|uniref:DNA polymerase n=1 Tax=Desulfovibrio sp. TaxID=885 RepID=UPI0030786062
EKGTKPCHLGNIHTANQKAAGLATRDNAKTFVYAFLYGAGDQKLGSIVEPYAAPARQAQVGKRLKAKFFRAIPAIKRLIDDVQSTVASRPYLYGIDGRRLHVRSKHSALNTLLQSAGAVLVKLATIICNKEAEARYGWVQGRDYTQVLHVHELFIVDVKPCELRETPQGQS